MKKLIIPVVVLLLLGIAAVAVPIALRYDYVQYEKNVLAHFMSGDDTQAPTAEYQAEKTQIPEKQMDRLQWLLTITERQRVFIFPDYDAAAAVIVAFPDGALFTIVEAADAPDKVFIFYTYNGKRRCYSVEGYNAFQWLLKIINRA